MWKLVEEIEFEEGENLSCTIQSQLEEYLLNGKKEALLTSKKQKSNLDSANKLT